MTKPSRLACHDSKEAIAHAQLNTVIRNPADPYGASAFETCGVCHGAGREFSPEKVHNISNPYKPPYPREEKKSRCFASRPSEESRKFTKPVFSTPPLGFVG